MDPPLQFRLTPIATTGRDDRQATRHIAPSLPRRTTATIWRWRDELGTQSHVTISAPQARDFVRNLANAVSARPEPGPLPPFDEHTTVYRWAPSRFHAAANIGTGATNVPLSAVAEVLTTNLPRNAWLALAVAPMPLGQARLVAAWAGDQIRDRDYHKHHWSADHRELLIGDLVIGVPPGTDPHTLLEVVTSALPSFDLNVRPLRATETGVAAGGLGIAGVLTLPAFTSAAFPNLPIIDAAITLDGPNAMAAAGGAGLFAVAASTRAFHLSETQLRRRISRGHVIPRRARLRNVGRSIYFRVSGKPTIFSETRYPRDGAIAVSAGQIAAFAQPAATASEETSATTAASKRIPASAPMRRRDGILLGADPTGHAVRVAYDNMFAGVEVFGDPGTGKTQLLEQILAGVLLARSGSATTPPIAGGRVATICIEAKGSPDHWLRVARHFDPDSVLIDASDRSTPRLDLFTPDHDPIGAAGAVASAMRDAFTGEFGDQAALSQSLALWQALLAVAVQVDAAIAERAIVPHRGVFGHAYTLIGGRGDDSETRLWRSFAEAASRAEQEAGASGDGAAVTALGKAAAGWRRYAELRKQPREWRQLASASLNKIQLLQDYEAFDDPQREALSWDDIINGSKTVVLALGTPGPSGEAEPPEETTNVWTALAFATLRQRIRALCRGWGPSKQGVVAVINDEISLSARTNPEAIQWLRDQGREFGVWPIFATQRPGQLDPKVREALLTFESVLWLKLANHEVRQLALDHLDAARRTWADEDLAFAPRFQAIAKCEAPEGPQPAFTLLVPQFFRVDLREFAAASSDETLPRAWFT